MTAITREQLTIVPANQASWQDVQAVFGTTDYPGRCYCQRFKTAGWHWDLSDDERRDRLREQTHCDDPDSPETSGLIAYLEDEPVGWVAVDPRTAYPRLRGLRTVWSGRQEDKADDSVWAVTCFTVRKGYRKRGITYALAAATVDYARERGALALEAYAMITEPGKEITWGELHVGSVQVFEEAGFTAVSRPSKRRVVMRLDLGGSG
ncbi:GNAT family N-acetyltransferase [Fodinicola acaciae]|uniref:GNAT family N-acetyltransferase n=1 Tax=Fodinicola acaciae TaxID=2681555 RepID=UPI001C9E7A93|nr:GNAT family N-acetyltransferase [Fodinicola acaciae]